MRLNFFELPFQDKKKKMCVLQVFATSICIFFSFGSILEWIEIILSEI